MLLFALFFTCEFHDAQHICTRIYFHNLFIYKFIDIVKHKNFFVDILNIKGKE